MKDALRDWQDWDVAAHALAIELGLVSPDSDAFGDAKHVYWTNNALGNALHESLNLLASGGILERRDEPDIQFRWRR